VTEYHDPTLPVGGPTAATTDQQQAPSQPQEPNGSRPGIARVTVNLPSRVWDAFYQMAEAQGVSRTEMLRRCISTEHFRWEVDRDGGSIQVRNADGSVDQVRFPW
jgi:hypothetical protein